MKSGKAVSIYKNIWKYVVITFASAVYGAGISLFIDPNNLAPGGISGLSIIVNRLVPIPTGTLYLIINIPIMILGIWKFGFKFFISTMYSVFAIAAFTNIFSEMAPLTNQPLLGGIFGGMLVAAGVGVVMRVGATTGGADIIVKCLKQWKPYLKTGMIFLCFDAIVICTGGIVFGNLDAVFYGVISSAVGSQVMDFILYGRDEAKMIFIISNVSEAITERILKELDTGVTHLTGTGAYKREDKQVILCVVRKQNVYNVEEIVKQEDASAFMIISNATEIYGEGYKSYYGERL